MTEKNLFVSRDQKVKLRELAWQNRTSMTGIIGQIIDDYAEGKVRVDPPEAVSFPVGMKFAPPESYESALERAASEGVSLAYVIRTEIDRRAAG